MGLLALVAAGAPAASAAPGDPDPSFGTGGVVRMLPSNEDIFMRGVATQPDGKIVLAGGDFVTNTTIVVRLLENGALDPSFGGDGIVNLALGTESSTAQAVLVQPDGKILLAGGAKGAVNFDFMFARLSADGLLDPSFGGGDGYELVAVGAEGDRANSVALGPGGRIVAAGEVALPASVNAAGVVVLTSSGLPDPGYFGGDGVTFETTTPKNDRGVDAAMLGDGRVLLADANGAGGGDGFTLIQLLASGARDPSFGLGDGEAVALPPSAGSPTGIAGRVMDFKLLGDGRIVASGYGYDEVGSPPVLDIKAAVARFLADGQLDESFGSSGWFTHQFGLGEDNAGTIDVTPAGRLVIAGSHTAQSSPITIDSPALARLDPGGALDPTFGTGGIVLNGITAPFGESFEDAALDPEERVVVAGRAYVGDGNTEVVVRRILGDKVPVGPPAVNQAPHARMKKVPKKVKAAKLKRFSGTASDPEGATLTVQVAVVKLLRGSGASASRIRPIPPRCKVMNAKAKFRWVKAKGPRRKATCPQRWLAVKGKAKWSFKLKKALPPGRYVVYARAVDASGLAESAFSRKAGNRYAFRVLPPR